MAIAVGDRIPDVRVMTPGPDGPVHVQTGDVLGTGKVVLVRGAGRVHPDLLGLPSARATSSATTSSMAKGVDSVACISVNDPFVMDAWGEGPEGRRSGDAAGRRER